MKVTIVSSRQNAQIERRSNGVLTDYVNHSMEAGAIIVKFQIGEQEFHAIEDVRGLRVYTTGGSLELCPVASNTVVLKVKPD